jgi:Tol biopolymer transport system component
MKRTLLSICALTVALAASARAQVTQRVSLASNGVQGNRDSSYGLITPDGRYVAFTSQATNLVPGDTNGSYDVFVRDRTTGITERVSVGAGGVEANGDSYLGGITPDGRYVAFGSAASNLVPGDTNGQYDGFVRDRWNHTTEIVSLSYLHLPGDGASGADGISDDGRFVVFASDATNLVPGDTNGFADVFVYDRRADTIERVSTDSNGGEAEPFFDDEYACGISGDGRYVVFASDAGNLVPGDTNGDPDIFVKDRETGVTTRVNVSTSGQEQQDYCCYEWQGCSISHNGRYVGFLSGADNLVPGDTNGMIDAFVHDMRTGETERVSVSSNGVEGDDWSWTPYISDDGRYAAFPSLASNLVPPDSNGKYNIFLRDRVERTTVRIDMNSYGVPTGAASDLDGISPDGRYVVFDSRGFDMVPGDTNSAMDVFVRDRLGGLDFTRVCEPSANGVIDCPCSNPPATGGSGCDNAAHTGGALLLAFGGTFLSCDSLLLRSVDEGPNALSVFYEGSSALASGAVYGQGVRCAGGTLLRLFTKNASNGSVEAPDPIAGEAGIAARSAELGEVIHPGETRWYFVAYRDRGSTPTCAARGGTNTTQTGSVLWSP